jgi:recombinational DNA repair protein RecR
MADQLKAAKSGFEIQLAKELKRMNDELQNAKKEYETRSECQTLDSQALHSFCFSSKRALSWIRD